MGIVTFGSAFDGITKSSQDIGKLGKSYTQDEFQVSLLETAANWLWNLEFCHCAFFWQILLSITTKIQTCSFCHLESLFKPYPSIWSQCWWIANLDAHVESTISVSTWVNVLVLHILTSIHLANKDTTIYSLRIISPFISTAILLLVHIGRRFNELQRSALDASFGRY